MTTNADPVIAQLQMLAAVAVRHAAEGHGITLTYDPEVLSSVGAILAHEAGDADQLPTLSTCYGAWFGELLVHRLAGRWIALHEASAPRIALACAVVSPIDAVRRLLCLQDGAPSLRDLFSRAESWAALLSDDAVLEQNASGWDRLARDPRFTAGTVPADRAAAEDLLDPWLITEGVVGRRVLCLAAGGGRHAPLFARAGAEVTVVDLSPAQLAIDRALAQRHDLKIATIQGSLDALTTLVPAASFDVVVQPVSACYVRDLVPVHAGIAHALRPGGLLVAQHKQPAALQATSMTDSGGWRIELPQVDGLPLPPVLGQSHREGGTQEFLHSLDALIGGLCRAGFVIEDVGEPALADAWATAGSPEHRAAFLPPYLKLKARRR